MIAMIAERNVAIAATTTAEIDTLIFGPGCRMYVLIPKEDGQKRSSNRTIVEIER